MMIHLLHIRPLPRLRAGLLLLVGILLAPGCAPTAPTAPPTLPAKPTNVILMVGDGMGLAQVSTLYFNDAVPTSHFDRFQAFGYIKTMPVGAKITDSAAAGTSFASGVKTYNAAIGVDADTVSVETIVERLSRTGQMTGLVATSSIVHATPASFYAHVAHRNMYEDIAAQLPGSGVDFFAGGGVKFFANRKDGQDVYRQLIDAGFAMDSTALAGTPTPPQKYGFLLAPDGMPRMLDGRGSFLPDATRMAISYLDQGVGGFFLMVEGSQIDWGGHANDAEYLMTEMADFNEAIGAAIEFAARDGNTLVVVTADHETGGLAISTGAGYGEIQPTFSTGGHTGSLIPVFAFGPGAEAFSGIYENTEIYHKIVSATAW